MKSLHRTKTLDAYSGARLVIKEGMNYPSYMLLKEAARGVMSYIAEDTLGMDISDKTKLSRLLSFMDVESVGVEHIENIQRLVDAEQSGLCGIMGMEIDDLKLIKHSVKTLIARYMKEPI